MFMIIVHRNQPLKKCESLPLAKDLISQLISKEQKQLEGYKEKYTDAGFFKSNKPKKHFEAIIDSDELPSLLKRAKKLLS
jgi:hypothetical protein